MTSDSYDISHTDSLICCIKLVDSVCCRDPTKIVNAFFSGIRSAVIV